MHTGLNILKPTIISANPLKKFSQKDYYLDCNNKLYGITIPESRWYHANQPEDIVAIEASLCPVWFLNFYATSDHNLNCKLLTIIKYIL